MKTLTYRVLFRKEVEGGGGDIPQSYLPYQGVLLRGFGEPLKVLFRKCY